MDDFKLLDRMIRVAGFCLVITFLTGPYLVQAQDSFDEFKDQYEDGYADFLENFENGVAQSQEDFENYREAYEEEYQRFKEEMQEKWGDFKERSKKQWVEYKENGKLRVSTDFEEGEGSVEVLADSEEEAEKVEEEMPEKTAEALKSKGTREGFETEDLPNKDITEEPVLDGQLQKADSKTVDEHAKEIAKKNTETKEVTGDDGQTRYIVKVDFKLADDHIQRRARKIEDDVYKFAEQNNLDPALIFAIIHVESHFNPTAASHANAYGLMQLVPSTGGRDAYRRVFNEDGIPTKEFLFQPSNNIQMGCTFIDILSSNYFERAEDEVTREYLMISAYNTGAGNVSVAYTGNKNLSAAFPTINSMNPQENYNHLRKNLVYEEARNYLKKVTNQRDKYSEWKRSQELE